MHCFTAWRQWAVELRQSTAAVLGDSEQWNSCSALPHCLAAERSRTPAMRCLSVWNLCYALPQSPGGTRQWNSCNALLHCLGAVGSATHAMHCPAA